MAKFREKKQYQLCEFLLELAGRAHSLFSLAKIQASASIADVLFMNESVVHVPTPNNIMSSDRRKKQQVHV
jgi:hypothetical protein